jgi:hypothetical protein
VPLALHRIVARANAREQCDSYRPVLTLKESKMLKIFIILALSISISCATFKYQKESEIKQNAQNAANKIAHLMEGMFEPNHVFISVLIDTIRNKDLQFYNGYQKSFEKNEYKLIGDLEDSTATAASTLNMRAVLRLLVNDCNMVSLYDITPPSNQIADMGKHGFTRFKNIDIESELENGMFIITTTSESTPFEMPKGIYNHHVNLNEILLDSMIILHNNQVNLFCANYQTQCIKIGSINDFLNSQKRERFKKYEFRKDLPYYMTPKEFNAFTASYSKRFVEELKKELIKIHRH